MSIRVILPIVLFCAVMVETDAQSVSADSIKSDSIVKKESLGKRLNNKLSNNYFKSKYDTNYVVRPKEKWLLRAMVNQTGNYIHAKGTVNDIWSKYDLHTKKNTTIGLEVNYCDIAVSLSLNPAKIRGDYDDYEFNFEYHGNRISFDVNYQRATSLTGDVKLGDMDHLDEEGLRMNIVNVAAYYSFNHRRFSFPAAFTQSYIQCRSAGSWLAGISYQGGSIETTDALLARNPDAPDTRIYVGHFGIGGGYGYNWVLGRKWLLHFSMLPTFVVFNRNNMTVRGERKEAQHMRFNMIFNERAAIVYNFSPRYFAGVTLVMNNSVFDDDVVVVNQNKWRARASFGLRL